MSRLIDCPSQTVLFKAYSVLLHIDAFMLLFGLSGIHPTCLRVALTIWGCGYEVYTSALLAVAAGVHQAVQATALGKEWLTSHTMLARWAKVSTLVLVVCVLRTCMNASHGCLRRHSTE